MSIQGLLLNIETDIVTFTFTKVNGSSRIAEGTRNMDFIPKSHWPKGTGAEKNPGILTFFDWIKKEWRSCRVDSIFGPWKISKEHSLLKEIAENSKLI